MVKVKIKIKGDSPLISHRWSKDAAMRLNLPQVFTQKQKTPQDALEEFRESMYVIEEDSKDFSKSSFGFPSFGFKSSAYKAICLKKLDVALSNAFQIEGIRAGDYTLVPIVGNPAVMREDIVKNDQGKPETRYRGQIDQWRCELNIRYNPDRIKVEEIVSILNEAGFSCGVGDWRPGTNGSYGMFHVESVEL